MKALLKAKLIVMTFNVICPHCGEETTSPDGSYQWVLNEYYAGQEFECDLCRSIFKLPKAVAENKLQGDHNV